MKLEKKQKKSKRKGTTKKQINTIPKIQKQNKSKKKQKKGIAKSKKKQTKYKEKQKAKKKKKQPDVLKWKQEY